MKCRLLRPGIGRQRLGRYWRGWPWDGGPRKRFWRRVGIHLSVELVQHVGEGNGSTCMWAVPAGQFNRLDTEPLASRQTPQLGIKFDVYI